MESEPDRDPLKRRECPATRVCRKGGSRFVPRLRSVLFAVAVFASLPARAGILPGHAAWTPASSPPRAAVGRIIAREGIAISYGTGTLIDVRDQYGLVITNWHVVRDANRGVEVVFPCGFRSPARALKVDSDWDLAALVIWRPPVEPVRIAQFAPRPGDPLTICGWGQGQYREAIGRCTNYLAPQADLPREMVELSAEARQGDSGGPILNASGELAGVLFGAGRGFTLGSFGGRVQTFLASLAPDIGNPDRTQLENCLVGGGPSAPAVTLLPDLGEDPLVPVADSSGWVGPADGQRPSWQIDGRPDRNPARPAVAENEDPAAAPSKGPVAVAIRDSPPASVGWEELTEARWFRNVQGVLAVVGIAAILMRLMRLAA